MRSDQIRSARDRAEGSRWSRESHLDTRAFFRFGGAGEVEIAIWNEEIVRQTVDVLVRSSHNRHVLLTVSTRNCRRTLAFSPAVMNTGEHLVLRNHRLPASGEWAMGGHGWSFVRIDAGEGILFLNNSTRLLSAGEVFVSSPAHGGQVRASLAGSLQIHHFQVRSDLLAGVLSAFEQQQLMALSIQPEQSVRWFQSDSEVAKRFRRLCEEPMPGISPPLSDDRNRPSDPL